MRCSLLHKTLLRCAAALSLAMTSAVVTADGGNYYYNPGLRVATPVVRHCVCGKDHSVPRRRGVAILSPIESPDRFNRPVGGKTVVTPYYVDYCPHRHHGPRVLVPGNGVGYYVHGGMHGGIHSGVEVNTLEQTSYGNYTGASRDEQRLLHLGGGGNIEPPLDPSEITPDLLDHLPSGH